MGYIKMSYFEYLHHGTCILIDHIKDDPQGGVSLFECLSNLTILPVKRKLIKNEK